MNGLRRIMGNALISLFGQAVTWASTLVLTIAYGRFLGDVKFGELYFAITFVALIGFPVEFGFNQQLTRDVAEDPGKARAYLWNTLLIKVALWVLLYSLILLLVWALGYGAEQRDLVMICGITLMSGSIVSTFAALHYAFERTFYPAVGLMLEKGLAAGVGVVLLKNGATVQAMALVLLGGSLLDVAWVAFWFFRLVGGGIVVSREGVRKLFQSSIPFVVYGILGVIYYRIDTVLLSLMTNTAVVGWYGAGYRLFDTLLFIPNLILNAVMYPVFSKLSVHSRPALQKAVEKCMNLLLICAIPIATLMIVAAPNIVGFLYHRAEFAHTIPVVQGLAPGLVFLYMNTLFNSVIVSTRGERKIPSMAAAALVFNLGLNLLLIPLYRQVGAAWVTSLTELLLLCISCVLMPRYLLPGRSLVVGGKVLLAALGMSAAVFLLRTYSIIVILPFALLVYGTITLLLRTVPGEDVRALYRAVRYRNRGAIAQSVADEVEEAIYTQSTQRLPPIKIEAIPAYVEAGQTSEAGGDEITVRLPRVRKRRERIEARDELGGVKDDDGTDTQRLPRAGRAKTRLAGSIRLEKVEG